MKPARTIWVGVAVVALLAVAAYVATHQRATTEFQSTDDFLASARKAAEKTPGDGAEAGFIPGTSEKGGIPKIELPMATLDLGVVSHAKTTVVDFPIKNAGTGTLIISDIGTTCHCTEGAMADGQNVIKPGKQGIMKVSLHPERVPDGFSSHKQLSLRCNDPRQPIVTLDVLSKVDPEFSVEPDTLAFGEVAKGQVVSKTLRVRQVSDEPFEVTGVVPSHPEDEKKLELSFEKLPASEWAKADHVEYNVKVTLPASLPAGGFASGIKIQNTCPRQNVKDFYLPVSATVTAFYRLSTPKLTIPATDVKPGKPDIGSFTIEADKPFEVKDVSITEPLLTVSTAPGAKPNSYVFTVGLSPMATAGLRLGEIHFTVKSGDESFAESVPVQVVVPVVHK